eukprot:4445786-Amphidinium_carterae.1
MACMSEQTRQSHCYESLCRASAAASAPVAVLPCAEAFSSKQAHAATEHTSMFKSWSQEESANSVHETFAKKSKNGTAVELAEASAPVKSSLPPDFSISQDQYVMHLPEHH